METARITKLNHELYKEQSLLTDKNQIFVISCGDVLLFCAKTFCYIKTLSLPLNVVSMCIGGDYKSLFFVTNIGEIIEWRKNTTANKFKTEILDPISILHEDRSFLVLKRKKTQNQKISVELIRFCPQKGLCVSLFKSKEFECKPQKINMKQERELVALNCSNVVFVLNTNKETVLEIQAERTVTCFDLHENNLLIGDQAGKITHVYCIDQLKGKMLLKEHKNKTTYHWHRRSVSSVLFAVDGKYLLSAGMESVVVLWKINKGINNRTQKQSSKQFLPRLGGKITSLSLGESRESCLAVTDENKIAVIKLDSFEVFGCVVGIAGKKILASSSERIIVQSSTEGVVQSYNLENHQAESIDVCGYNQRYPFKEVTGVKTTIDSACLLANGLITAESTQNEITVKCWETDKKHYRLVDVSKDEHQRKVKRIKHSGSMFVTLDDGGWFILWSARNGLKVFYRGKYRELLASDLSLRSDSKEVAVLCEGRIVYWTVHSQLELSHVSVVGLNDGSVEYLTEELVVCCDKTKTFLLKNRQVVHSLDGYGIGFCIARQKLFVLKIDGKGLAEVSLDAKNKIKKEDLEVKIEDSLCGLIVTEKKKMFFIDKKMNLLGIRNETEIEVEEKEIKKKQNRTSLNRKVPFSLSQWNKKQESVSSHSLQPTTLLFKDFFTLLPGNLKGS